MDLMGNFAKPAKGLVFGLIATLIFSVPANAQLMESFYGPTMETILENAGLNPDMQIDSKTGAPVAFGKAGDFNFVARAMNCSGIPKSCEELMFFANFPLGRPLRVTDLVAVNNYNESQVFGRAYVVRPGAGDGEVGVDYVIELGGGVSRQHVEENVARWADVLTAFIASMTSNASS